MFETDHASTRQGAPCTSRTFSSWPGRAWRTPACGGTKALGSNHRTMANISHRKFMRLSQPHHTGGLAIRTMSAKIDPQHSMRL